MIENKIQELIVALNRLKEEYKAIKKSIRTEEKITDETEYESLKRAYKQLKEQIKDFEDAYRSSLYEDEAYTELIKLKEQKEEEIVKNYEKLNKLIAELPQKPVEMKMETEEGHTNVQIFPEMRMYINGKEEKLRKV